jgi:hypothetical protein
MKLTFPFPMPPSLPLPPKKNPLTWLVDKRHGSLNTSFRNGTSTSKYLDTTYKQNKCLPTPLPVMASRYCCTWRSHANRSSSTRLLLLAPESDKLRIQSQDSREQARTVSVLPSRKRRVMDASYVKWCLPMSALFFVRLDRLQFYFFTWQLWKIVSENRLKWYCGRNAANTWRAAPEFWQVFRFAMNAKFIIIFIHLFFKP